MAEQWNDLSNCNSLGDDERCSSATKRGTKDLKQSLKDYSIFSPDYSTIVTIACPVPYHIFSSTNAEEIIITSMFAIATSITNNTLLFFGISKGHIIIGVINFVC